MKQGLSMAGMWLGLTSAWVGHTTQAEAPHFQTEVLPALTRAGCNTGACHGAATGQGGFRLSLLGYDAEFDFRSLTREGRGRRISVTQPEDSLVLLKPSRQLRHKGGEKLSEGSAAYEMVRRWIAGGAPRGRVDLEVAELSLEPRDILLAKPGSGGKIQVQARLTDGTRRDVTDWCVFTTDDTGLATLDTLGRIRVLRRGVTTMTARFGGRVVAGSVGAVFQEAAVDAGNFHAGNWIDEALLKGWRRLHLPPSQPATDSEWLRRVCLDLVGRLPEPEEVRAHLTRPLSAEDREAIVDRLLGAPEFNDFWTLKLADLFLLRSGKLGEAPASAFHQWLRRQVELDTPLLEWVNALIVAQGDPAAEAAANFYRLHQDPRDQAEYVGQTLLGLRIGCARCHNHPFDRWTQSDYYGFAAHFARVELEGGRVTLRDQGELPHPKTGHPVGPIPLGEARRERLPGPDRRAELAAWLASPDNTLLWRAFANRLWGHIFGRGLIDPVDDLRLTNPPSHPVLLEALQHRLRELDGRLRPFLRELVLSSAYGLSSRSQGVNAVDERHFSRAYLKPLQGPVLADAIAQVTGVRWAFPGQPAGIKAVALVGPDVPSPGLDVLGRCQREDACTSPDASGMGLAAALHLINGPTINKRLTMGLMRRMHREHWPADQRLEELYVRTLSRFPSAVEQERWLAEVPEADTERADYFEDLLWALLNSREFMHNH